MHSRMIKFLDEHKILFKHQFGFQKHKSTTLAILDLYTKLIENIEGKRFFHVVYFLTSLKHLIRLITIFCWKSWNTTEYEESPNLGLNPTLQTENKLFQ